MEGSARVGEEVCIKVTDDVIMEILTKLPVSSVLKFRCVCKSWCWLTKEQSFIRTHTRRLCDRPKSSMVLHPYPFVVPRLRQPRLRQLPLCRIDTDTDNNDDVLVARSIDITSVIPEDYAGMELFLRAACDGLLCFAVAEGPNPPYFICNPTTRTWTTVAASPNQSPKRTGLRRCPGICLRAIYFHRSTGEYRLLQHFSKGESDIGHEVATVNGDKSWRTVHRILDRDRTEMDRVLAKHVYWYYPAVTKGSLHWLNPYHEKSSFGIIVFDTEAEEFRQMLVPVDSKPRHEQQETLLYEIGGNLCIALKDYDGRCGVYKSELWLLKDCGSQRWVKMHTVISENGIYDIRTAGHQYSTTTTTPTTAEDDSGKLLIRWGIAGPQFSLYNFKLKTSSHIFIRREISCSGFFHDYTESLVML